MSPALWLVGLALFAQTAPAPSDGKGSTIRVVSKKSATPTAASPIPSPPIVASPSVASPLVSPIAASPSWVEPAPPLPAARVAPAEPALTVQAEAAPANRTRWVPILALGGSAVAGSLGAVFAVRTLNAVDDAGELKATLDGNQVKVSDEYKDQQKAVLGNGLAATLLISTAVAGAVTSLILLASD